jgi:hypothetical protein
MTARVLVADEAVGRLAELGLSADLLERVVRRAGAEAAFCVLPVFPRGEIRLADGLAPPDSAGDRGIVVEVSRL